MTNTDRVGGILELTKALMKEGYKNILFLDRKQAQKVLTEKRIELLEVIKKNQIKSIRDLARKVERKVSNVYNDLILLAEYGIIEFKKKGNRKIPEIKPENIFIKPIKLKNKMPFAKA